MRVGEYTKSKEGWMVGHQGTLKRAGPPTAAKSSSSEQAADVGEQADVSDSSATLGPWIRVEAGLGEMAEVVQPLLP